MAAIDLNGTEKIRYDGSFVRRAYLGGTRLWDYLPDRSHASTVWAPPGFKIASTAMSVYDANYYRILAAIEDEGQAAPTEGQVKIEFYARDAAVDEEWVMLFSGVPTIPSPWLAETFVLRSQWSAGSWDDVFFCARVFNAADTESSSWHVTPAV